MKRLERKMYGYNYEVHFGIEALDNCATMNEVCKKLSIKYADTRFYDIQPKLTDKLTLWDSINYGFAYRGDHAAGLELTLDKEKYLLIEKGEYESFLRQFLTK